MLSLIAMSQPFARQLPDRQPLASQAISTHESHPLHEGWQLAGTAPGAIATAAELTGAQITWQAAVVPGTVAQAIHTDINIPGPYDQQDWWYRTEFARPAAANMHRLRCDGLATIADVWLNGHCILSSRNMFCAHTVDITGTLLDHNELVICFRALSTLLDQKRPRPRWKTALTSHQNLRWIRTTLLGRMPAWSPPINPVGPWRSIALEAVNVIDVHVLNLQTELRGSTGIAKLQTTFSGTPVTHAKIHIGEHHQTLDISHDASSQTIAAAIEIPNVQLWWPHTHGQPALLPCHLELITAAGMVRVDCGRIGFKSIVVDRRNDGVQFVINGVRVFCRGACWTTNDFLSLTGTEASLREVLELCRAANMNMLRIGGTMTYESPRFFELCDELGIMVWQDFMFANMDYPVGDPEFRNTIDAEITQQLTQLQRHVCIAAYCAGSEIEQQAAMMGLPSSEWSNAFFADALPVRCADLHAGIPYFRGSPSEGALPFHVSSGVAHYYGIGAYRRPLSDAKHAGVKFASECLGISNVPEPETIALMLDGVQPVPHHPRWKARVPRDNGSGYDFEDIRDFYLHELYGLDPVKLRSENPARYYAISRAVSGEVMLRTCAEWRRADNPCSGALIWFCKDLWPGAGWGVIDSENRPKAALHFLRRAFASQTVLITDEGQDGLKLHIFNDSPQVLNANLQVEYLQHGKTRTFEKHLPVQVAAHSAIQLSIDAIANRFTDGNYAYRFGPPGHDTVIARLCDSTSGSTLGEDFYFPTGLTLPWQEISAIRTQTQQQSDGSATIILESTGFLQNLAITAPGFTSRSSHLHIAPGQQYQFEFTALPNSAGKKFKAYLDALNLRETLTVRADTTS